MRVRAATTTTSAAKLGLPPGRSWASPLNGLGLAVAVSGLTRGTGDVNVMLKDSGAIPVARDIVTEVCAVNGEFAAVDVWLEHIW